DAEIEEVKVVEGATDFRNWQKPFVMSAKFSSQSYLEQAGNSLLFKLGDLIGAQSEMYQEDARRYEIENVYNRGYDRKIVVNIPEGYTIQNPDDIKIKEEVKEGDKTIYLFDADYELNGNQLTVSIDEFYDQIYYPAEKIDDFRKVINAAADFNKVTLIMKRK
ncbi:MAG: nuclease domain-containing protein, partial [Cyclobacteriaceae bacterium]